MQAKEEKSNTEGKTSSMGVTNRKEPLVSRDGKILVKVAYMTEFSTTICVDEKATVLDVISTVCTKKSLDPKRYVLKTKTGHMKGSPLDNELGILPFCGDGLMLVSNDTNEDKSECKEKSQESAGTIDRRASIYRGGFMRKMRNYNRLRLLTSDTSTCSVPCPNSSTTSSHADGGVNDSSSRLWSPENFLHDRDRTISRNDSVRDASKFMGILRTSGSKRSPTNKRAVWPLVTGNHFRKHGDNRKASVPSRVNTALDGFPPKMSETSKSQTFRLVRTTPRPIFRGITSSNVNLTGSSEHSRMPSSGWGSACLLTPQPRSICAMYLRSAIKYSPILDNTHFQDYNTTTFPRRLASTRINTTESRINHLKCNTEPLKDANRSFHTFSDYDKACAKSNSAKCSTPYRHTNSISTASGSHRDLCDTDTLATSAETCRKSHTAIHRGPNSYSTRIARASTNPVEEVNVYVYIPFINESVSVCINRSFPAEKLLYIVCNEHTLDFCEYTLECQDGSCVELDVRISKYYELSSGRALHFNMVQKGKIYKSMSFYKDDIKILTTVSKDGVVQIASALPKVLIDIFVNYSFSSKCPDVDYIRTLILTYRSYTTPLEFFNSVMSTVPEFTIANENKEPPKKYERDLVNPLVSVKDKVYSIEAMSSSSVLTTPTLSTAPALSDCSNDCDIKTSQTEVGENGAKKLSLSSRLDCAMHFSTGITDSLSPISDNGKTDSFIGLHTRTCKEDTLSTFNDSFILDAPVEHSFRITKEIIPDCETRMRNVLTLIRIWLDKYYFDFCLCHDLEDRLRDILSNLKNFIGGIFNNEVENITILLKDRNDIYLDLIKDCKLVTGKGKSMFGMIKNINAEDLASQLCLYDYQIARTIHPIEYLNRLWNKDDKNLSPLMNYFIERFDIESLWAATEVLTAESPKERSIILKNLIITAAKCLEYNNFFSTFAIASGLNSPPISRLKKTWESLPDKVRIIWNKLGYVINPTRNMKNYRDIMSRASPPILPFLPIYFKDLLFADDGNPTLIEDKLVNFEKFVMIANIVSDICICTSVEYNMEPIIHVQNFIKNPPIIRDTNQLMIMSYKCEHRASSTADGF